MALHNNGRVNNRSESHTWKISTVICTVCTVGTRHCSMDRFALCVPVFVKRAVSTTLTMNKKWHLHSTSTLEFVSTVEPRTSPGAPL